MKRTARLGLILLLTATVSCSAPRPDDHAEELRRLARGALAQIDGALELAGVTAPVEILRDRWGVPHIYADNIDDLFFAQGLVAAQDRLWQMEWWRRYGAGELAEVLGPAAVPPDRFARLLRYRGDLQAEFTSYHPEGERILTAFAAGVNAWIGWASERGVLPVEFELTGIEPGEWTAEVPILRMAGLAMTGNNLRELDLARRVAELGVEEANRLAAPDPWQELRVPDGLDPAIVPEDFRLQMLGAPLPTPALRDKYSDSADLFQPLTSIALAGPLTAARAGVTRRSPGEGSNNWVVDGSMSATGAPLLANDPHRSIALPSLRYLTHLNAPGWNVIGGGEPALPGVAIGHNERVGWGLTIVGIDQGDIFVETLNPESPDQVWHNDAWEPLHILEEEIAVRGESAMTVQLKFSHHGPILWEDAERGVAYAFKTVLTEPGTAGYLGSLSVDQATDWDSYVDALAAWKVPSENMIYADVDGNIGWLAAGLTPLRDGWVGRLPVPGDGSFEWQGFRDTRELPQEYNPGRRFIATANHNIMPADYAPPLGYRWANPTRFERLRTLLSNGGPFNIDHFKALQYEVFSQVAADRVARMAEWTFEDAQAERAREFLQQWDAVLGVDSAPALLYKTWERFVNELGADPDSVAEQDAEAAVLASIATLEADHVGDWNTWRWGDVNRLDRSHQLVDTFDLPTVERPGDGTTVNLGRPAHGASFREVLDVSNWDNSVATSTPGQSGQPLSPFYRNLGKMWTDGEYFPLLFTREAVTQNVAHRLLLLPSEEP